jgi:8-oxo-dGTP diphosphatase
MSGRYLDPADWYASLPTVYVSACALLTDAKDRVLLVKPNYRPYWAVPGGILDDGESPHECARREIAEELGLTITPHELLTVDFVPPQGDRPRPMINLLFNGGTIHEPEHIRLQHDELDAAEFFTWDAAAAKMPASTAARIPAARLALKNQHTIYLPATAT